MLAEQARALFEQYNRYPGQALLNHNRRIAAFARELAHKRNVSVDADLLGAGCHLHDIGLLIAERADPSYLRRGWRFFAPYGRRWGLDSVQRAAMREMLLYNHSLRPLPGPCGYGELVRLGVEVEHSLGVWAHGLDWAFCRQVFERIPRLDLTRILLDFARITLFEDGPGQLFRIFFPRFEF